MDESPTALFDAYEQDLKSILIGIQEKTESDGRGEQRKAALRRVEIELDEAEELISQMEIEIQGIPQSIKASYQSRFKTAKADLVRYKKRSRELHAQLSRSDLIPSFARSDNPYGSEDDSDRTRLLTGTALLSDGSRRLQDSQRIALDTEAQGAEILTSLRAQREQIENARDTLGTAEVSIGRASGTLKTMTRRMYQQRVVIAGIILLLVALIVLILWFKLKR